MKDKKLSNNFSLSEFGYVTPEKKLIDVLQYTRDIAGSPIIITDGPRDVIKHINTYKKLVSDGKLQGPWYDEIKWGSRHLPAFGMGLRAADIACKGKSGKILSGDFLAGILRQASIELGIYLGIGVGSTFCHVDIDREKNVEWAYNY